MSSPAPWAASMRPQSGVAPVGVCVYWSEDGEGGAVEGVDYGELRDRHPDPGARSHLFESGDEVFAVAGQRC